MGFFGDVFNAIFDPGKKDREKANDLYSQSVNSQAATEAWKKQLLEDRLDIANKFLFGGDVFSPDQLDDQGNPVEGAQGFEIKGALPQAQGWEARFFDFLEKSPDTTYNAQRSQLEKGTKDAKKAITANLNKRGLSNSVMGAAKLGKLDLNRISGLSKLEGERIDRKGQRIAQGTDFAESILDRALNMGNSASGMANNFNTRVPYMLQGVGNNYMNQANAAGPGIGQDLISEASRNMFDRMFPTTVATPPQSQAGGWGQKALEFGAKYLLGG